MQTKNIIFDFGGVFLNLDFSLTEKAFRNLSVPQFNAMFTQHHSHDLFLNLETGKISPQEFYDDFRKETGTNLTDEQIRDAWNALLLDFPQERVTWLEAIGKRYNVYLFSNTNQIHYDHFIADFSKNNNGRDFNSFFIKAYYSHELGLRKPDLESFEAIIKAEKLNPAETVFIDDTYKNIEGAQKTGLQTIHLAAPKTVLELGL
ncbi:HAD family phosphatase [Asinibacterium sp. OR53]|uniref:HAD family hydrolase n=1 Tax=Asinibacterium sp. OR53 TaxID=925409 RepID=UPI00047B6461|nr:HAD family phosphatase [Asinibacterium sp. OR53]